MYYWTETSPSASAIGQPNQELLHIQQTNIKHLTSNFTYMYFLFLHMNLSSVAITIYAIIGIKENTYTKAQLLKASLVNRKKT